jgi:UDP-N-acetylglucosamine transferase subunit ALG13
MIFVTVGTTAAFDRLLQAVETLHVDEELLVQRGPSTFVPKSGTYVDFMPYDEVVNAMHRASVVVMHAGVGSILTAIEAGKRPVVVSRSRLEGEAVDDHQVGLAQRLHDVQVVVHVDDLAKLPDAIAAARLGQIRLDWNSTLADEIAAHVTAVCGVSRAGSRPNAAP